MNKADSLRRRRFLTRAVSGAGALVLAGCNKLSQTEWFPKVLGISERVSEAASHLVTSRKSMAQEFAESDRSPQFRSNGTAEPNSDAYRALAANRFGQYRLEIGGMVDNPMRLSLVDLRGVPS